MTSEALCPTTVSDAFTNHLNVTNSTLDSILSENANGKFGTTIEPDFMEEEFVSGDNAFYEYHGDDRITKRNAKLWEINGVFYNRSEVRRICEPVS